VCVCVCVCLGAGRDGCVGSLCLWRDAACYRVDGCIVLGTMESRGRVSVSARFDRRPGYVSSRSCGRVVGSRFNKHAAHANAEFPVHTLFRELGWCSREDIGWLVGWAGCCGPGRPGATQWPNDQPRDGRLSESSRMVFVDWPCWRGRTAAPPGLCCQVAEVRAYSAESHAGRSGFSEIAAEVQWQIR
jgi:hypothetical protein